MMRLLARRALVALPWLCTALVVCAVTALILLPAAWVAPQFARASGSRVNLIDPSGSLWHGSATLMLAPGADPRTATVLPGRIEWTTAFWPLLTGHVRMRMRHTDAMPDPVFVDASLTGTATVSPGTLEAPATLLAGLGAPFNTLDLQGDFRLEWTTWRIFGGNAYGQLALRLRDAASSVSRVKPLGSYRVVLVAAGRDATIALSTLKGPLQLSGNGTIEQGGATFHGLASADEPARENLAGLLNLLGPRVADNEYALIFR